MTAAEAIAYFKKLVIRIKGIMAEEDEAHKDRFSQSLEATETAVRSLEAWEKVKADITETMLYYKDWGQVEIKAQHKEEALKDVLDCINRHLTEVTECRS